MTRTTVSPRLKVLVALSLALLAAVSNLAGVDLSSAVRVLAGLVLVLAPAYVIPYALFPPAALRLGEHWAVAGALGAAVIVFTGLVLDLTSAGLDRTTWSIALVVLTAGLAVIAFARHAPKSAPSSGGPPGRFLPTVIVFSIALLAGTAALAVARQSSLRQEKKTQFLVLWALPVMKNARISAIRFGVQNKEHHARVLSVTAHTAAGAPAFRVRLFDLAADGAIEWLRPVGRDFGNLTIELHLGRSQSVIRHVTIWESFNAP